LCLWNHVIKLFFTTSSRASETQRRIRDTRAQL
jgi:hypothetical protein